MTVADIADRREFVLPPAKRRIDVHESRPVRPTSVAMTADISLGSTGFVRCT